MARLTIMFLLLFVFVNLALAIDKDKSPSSGNRRHIYSPSVWPSNYNHHQQWQPNRRQQFYPNHHQQQHLQQQQLLQNQLLLAQQTKNERSWLCYPNSYYYYQQQTASFGRFSAAAAVEFFTESDRCNGDYKCSNGRDERSCPEKCIASKYTEAAYLASCKQSRPRWQFDAKTRRCQFYVFAGCSIQENQFLTKSECELECLWPITTEDEHQLKIVASGSRHLHSKNGSNGDDDGFKSSDNNNNNDDDDDSTRTADFNEIDDAKFKQSEPIIGKYLCDNGVTNPKNRRYYNDTDRCNGIYDCENGLDEMNCSSKCFGFRYGDQPDLIDCRASIPRYLYHASQQKCIFFEYGGCADVVNQFRTEAECLNECKGVVIAGDDDNKPKSLNQDNGDITVLVDTETTAISPVDEKIQQSSSTAAEQESQPNNTTNNDEDGDDPHDKTATTTDDLNIPTTSTLTMPHDNNSSSA